MECEKMKMSTALLVLAWVLWPWGMWGRPALAEEPDYSNDLASAHPVDPNGQLVIGVLHNSQDVDWLTFSATAQGLYEVTVFS